MAGIGRRLSGAGLIAVVVGVAPSAAEAANVRLEREGTSDQYTLVYEAGENELNAVQITGGSPGGTGPYVISEQGSAVNVVGGEGCTGEVAATPGSNPSFLEQLLGAEPTPGTAAREAGCQAPSGGRVFRVVIRGRDSPDTLMLDAETSPAGRNLVDGGTGDDVIAVSPRIFEADDLVGGADRDRVTYELRNASVNADGDCAEDDGAIAVPAPGSGPERDNISHSVEVLYGSTADDTMTGLTGTPSQPCPESDSGLPLSGLPADDELRALGGDDRVLPSAGQDTILGGSGNDVVEGGTGDDRIDGQGGNDVLRGDGAEVPQAQGGSDTIHGDEGDDIVDGDGGNDSLHGEVGQDYLTGDAGRDVLDGDDGNDNLDLGPAESGAAGDNAERANGDEGQDVLDLRSRQAAPGVPGDALNAEARTLALRGGAGGQAVVENFEGYLAGDGDDAITGTERSEYLFGGAGNDMLGGGAGNDIIDGADHNDLLSGGDGEDLVFGQHHDDTLVGDAGRDRLHGGPGNDDLDGREGNDDLLGGEEAFGQAVPTGLEAHALAGSGAFRPAAVDVLRGGGTDTARWTEEFGSPVSIVGRRDPVRVDLDDQADDGEEGENDFASPELDRLVGGAANDVLIGDANDETLEGGDGDDVLVGGVGRDRLVGGGGTDWVSYAPTQEQTGRTGGVIAVLSSPFGEDVIEETENLEGTAAPDRLYGEGGANVLRGGDGFDQLAGFAGNDRLEGGAAGDRLEGGEGTDELLGEAGDDSLDGQAGRDVVDAGDGSDVLHGGATAGDRDTLRPGPGTPDLITWADRTDPVIATVGEGQAGPQDVVEAGAEQLLGGQAADQLTGDGASELITGGPGDDRLNGAGGDDTIVGGSGADQLDGGFGNDVLSYRDRSDAVRLVLPGGPALADQLAEDQTSSFEGLEGGEGNDILIGNDAPNVLIGRRGSDQVDGRGANDLFRMRDGQGDAITCAAGDTVETDAADTVSDGCTRTDGPVEQDAFPGGLAIDRPIPAAPAGLPGDRPAAAPAAPAPAPAAQPQPQQQVLRAVVLRRSLVSFRALTKVSKGRLPVRVGCRGGNVPCSVAVAVFRNGRRVGRSTTTVPANGKRTVRVLLSSTTRRLINRGRRVTFRVDVLSVSNGQTQRQRRTVRARR
ncbi:MAG TPA: hypothetical protein VD931_12325 [Baekduia sp.]|nr:hypothetical protein [Baekduia sp.]